MNFDSRKMAAVMVCAMIGCALGIAPTSAETPETSASFRVVTKIFSGKAKQPAVEHLILFHDDLVYDLPQIDDGQVTVYDLKRDRVILLDRETQTRATTTTDELLKLTAQLRAKAITPQSRLQLGVDAVVDRSDDLSQYSISYGSLSYATTTQSPASISTAKQYGRFADLASQLSIARAIGMPPLGRMTLNRQIAEDGRVPQQTILTINQVGNHAKFRSTHDLVERISQADRKQIDEVGNMLALYREVPLRDLPDSQ